MMQLALDRGSAAGPVLILGREAGADWQSYRERCRAAFCEEGGRAWFLACDFTTGGPWAGAAQLFAALLPEIGAARPDLVERHDYELVRVLPILKQSLPVRYATLTDVSPLAEKVRSYPADRAFRIVAGLVDLLLAWKDRNAGESWLLCCEDFDRAGHIGGRFFRELGRRMAGRSDMRLILAVGPAAAAGVAEAFGVRGDQLADLTGPPELTLGGAPRPVLPRGAEDRDAQAALGRARELEQVVGGDKLRAEIHLAELLDCWRRAGNEERLFLWRRQALEIYNQLGLYEDALVYGQEVWAALDRFAAGDAAIRWTTFGKVFASHLALADAASALRLAEAILVADSEPAHRSETLYLLSMLHTRFLPQRDLDRAEHFLTLGLAALDEAELPAGERWFRHVFNRNGLALIRHLQGRPAEAIALCKEGFDLLARHLGASQHKLHRSVLLYNIAQVLVATGALQEGVDFLSAAIALDPNYSEYYNERGSLYLRLDQLDKARQDYERAIEVSPPYPEVYTNLGQCCRRAGSLDAAVAAYTRALELQPHQVLALLGRAQTHEMAGRLREAIADYGAALHLQPEQWEVLANRASLYFELGEYAPALADIDCAVALAPQVADLYQSRAVALEAVGRLEDARRDLQRSEELVAAGSGS